MSDRKDIVARLYQGKSRLIYLVTHDQASGWFKAQVQDLTPPKPGCEYLEFTEIPASQAALDCGAVPVRGNENTRQLWNSIWYPEILELGNLRIVSVIDNPRREGTRAYRVYGQMKKWVEDHPDGSVAEMLGDETIEYDFRDYEWDLNHGHIKIERAVDRRSV